MQRLIWGSVILAAGCAAEAGDPTSQTAQAPDPRPTGNALYDFSCRDQALPSTAADALSLRGFTNDSYMGSALPDVTVDLVSAATGKTISTTWSDDQGRLAFDIATGAQPVPAYARMSAADHVTSYLYPSRPLAEDQENVFFPVLPPSWRAELAGYAGVTLDPAKGIVAVIVTDCAGERVEGAQVTFDPPAEAVAYWDPMFTDPGDGATSINGHAWAFNVPAGPVRATITIGDLTYRDWPVSSFADGRTLAWRAP